MVWPSTSAQKRSGAFILGFSCHISMKAESSFLMFDFAELTKAGSVFLMIAVVVVFVAVLMAEVKG